ncbi:MAG: site-specific DNA-methyltransferase [Halobacteriovoraceae bacterium]|nr:site-specific DNA-methyltransferase [Halobacteriovoraceae bacterium]|tara:strand:+ start:27674 stop:28369 length:696 start_codon:yes stop_codon:yes gene_type:complete
MLNLLNGDCLELMKTIPDKSVDMILTDPPYDISLGGGGCLKGRAYKDEISDLSINNGFDVQLFLDLLTCKFKSKQQFNLVVFCSRTQIIEYLKYADLNSIQYGVGVWHKSNPIPHCNNTYLSDVEYIIYLKGKSVKIGGDYSTKSQVYKSATNRKDKRNFKHPTIKPIPLLEKYLINHSSECDVVFDPFMGSGSTGVACKNLNRKFIGIEKDEAYFNIAKDRIENHEVTNA